METADYPPALDHMLAAWNETDGTKVRSHLSLALAADVHFVDPTTDIVGIDAFEAMVHSVQSRIPKGVYSRISAIDSHHGLCRYHWAIHVDDQLVVQGLDVTTWRDGLVTEVIGFFGDLPLNRKI